MTKNFTYVNHSYLSSYKVYCFNIYEKHSLESGSYNFKYEEGDFLPLVSNNYIYSPNLLIVDFTNSMVHIVESSRYKKSIKIKGEVDSSVYEDFEFKSYMSIDIYGNLLNIFNIYDLYNVINSYPKVNLYLTENKFANHKVKPEYKQGEYEDVYMFVDSIKNYSYNNLVLSGYSYSDRLRKNNDISCLNNKSSLEIANDIKESIRKPLIEAFEDEFFDKESIYFKINYLLELFAINYFLENNPRKKIVKYRSCDKMKVTHIGRVKKDIVNFILSAEEKELEIILEIVLSCIYDDDYLDSVTSLLSSILASDN